MASRGLPLPVAAPSAVAVPAASTAVKKRMFQDAFVKVDERGDEPPRMRSYAPHTTPPKAAAAVQPRAFLTAADAVGVADVGVPPMTFPKAATAVWPRSSLTAAAPVVVVEVDDDDDDDEVGFG